MRDVAQQDNVALDLVPGLSAGDSALEDEPDFPQRGGAEGLRLVGKPGPSELGLEFVDLVHSVLELGVGRVFADAADGPAQDLGAAVGDARGD